jgi:hypothetical protein
MEEERQSLYVESVIPSYATAWDSRDVIILGKQAQTREFWNNERHKYDLFISQYVLDEISDGDPDAARKRLDFVDGIPVYPKTPEIERLAMIYQKLLDIPDRAKMDCNHLATCVIQHIHYLLTWNCTHLGAVAQMKIQDYNERHGLWTPLLVTPEALLPYIPLKEVLQ